MGIFLEVTFSNSCHAPASRFQYFNPAHPSSLIKGVLLDLLWVLRAVMAELGSSSTPGSIFSCAMSVLRQKLLLTSMISRFPGIGAGQLGEEMMEGERGEKRREKEAIRPQRCSPLLPYQPLHYQAQSEAPN